MRFFLWLLLCAFPLSTAQAQVVVSIKPLHSLVAGVMEGSGMEPALLVDGKTSLHDFSLKPSHASMLRQAQVVFYIGDDLEQFLAKILPQFPATTKRVAMAHVKGMTIYKMRAGKDFETHEHGHDHEHHAHGTHDLHLWMSPANARTMVAEIVRILAEIYPEQAGIFAENGKKIDATLASLDKELHARMKKLQHRPFAVFHDAIQYFDRAYGLTNIGALALNPEHGLRPRHVQELREHIREMKAVCLFSEPQFDRRIVDNLIADTGVRSEALDPEASLLTPGVNLYFQLMERTAQALEKCLSAGG